MGQCCSSCKGSSPFQDETVVDTESAGQPFFKPTFQSTNLHPITTVANNLLNSVSLFKATSFKEMAIPWPRKQEAGNIFRAPNNDDVVVAVSHAWPYQAHPDPLGSKVADLHAMMCQAADILQPKGCVLAFMDFLSIPQRPYLPEHEPRNAHEESIFKEALQAMPRTFLLADIILHLDLPLKQVPGDQEEVYVRASSLAELSFASVSNRVQIIGGVTEEIAKERIGMFDFVIAVDEQAVSNVEDVYRLCAVGGSAKLQKAPFGFRNEVPASDRGWIYLERFISMIKVALVDESEVSRVVLSNNVDVLQAIKAGGAKLREGAKKGEDHLQALLEEFLKELSTKKFSATSTDARFCVHTRNSKNAFVVSDEVIVAQLMKSLVAELPRRWIDEVEAQRQRQFVMAVSRADVDSVQRLLEARANTTMRFPSGGTALHVAARSQSLELVRILIAAKADLLAQDATSSCPAHACYLTARVLTPEIFALLAPSVEVLSLKNHACVTPFAKFRMWALTEGFQPGVCMLERWCEWHPDLEKQALPARSSLTASHWLRYEEPAGISTIYRIGSSNVTLHQWEHADQDVHVLIISLSSAPTCAGFNRIAEGLSKMNCGMSLWQAWKDVDLSAKPFRESIEDMANVLLEIPLPENLVLLTDRIGLPLHWALQDRIAGAMHICPDGWHTDEHMETPAYRGYVKIHHSLGDQCKDASFIANAYAKNTIYMDDPAVEMEPLVTQLEKCLKLASNEYFRSVAWCLKDALPIGITEAMRGRSSQANLFATILICSFGPPSQLEITNRICELLPHAEIGYLHRSRIFWFCEGDDVTTEILAEMKALIYRIRRRQGVRLGDAA